MAPSSQQRVSKTCANTSESNDLFSYLYFSSLSQIAEQASAVPSKKGIKSA